MTEQQMLVQIERCLHDLCLDTNCHPFSGLMADIHSISQRTVTLYDDYVSGIYDAEKLLDILQNLKVGEVSLESEDPNNIWNLIAECEVDE